MCSSVCSYVSLTPRSHYFLTGIQHVQLWINCSVNQLNRANLSLPNMTRWVGWRKLAWVLPQCEHILSWLNHASVIKGPIKSIISSYYYFMHPMVSLPWLLFASNAHYFPTSFSRLQLLCYNGELTVPCQVPSSKNVQAILLCSKICLLRSFVFSHFNFSIIFTNAE